MGIMPVLNGTHRQDADATCLAIHRESEIIRFLHCAPKRGSGLLRSVDLLWESPAN
jgi:hypothetical protein